MDQPVRNFIRIFSYIWIAMGIAGIGPFVTTGPGPAVLLVAVIVFVVPGVLGAYWAEPKTCPQCANLVAGLAPVCPHCSLEFKTLPARPKRRFVEHVAITIVISLAFAAFLMMSRGYTGS